MVTLGQLIAEGKTKKIYAHASNDELVFIVSKDDITAGDGVRRNILPGKSIWSTMTTANIFKLLNSANIATHFIEQINETTLLVHRCKMLPIEQVQRRLATGSYIKKHPDIKEGALFDPVLVETFLKDDANHDPQIWKEDIIKAGLATSEEVNWMEDEGRRVFAVLENAWKKLDITLVDLKIEFGRDSKRKLVVADVIDNDSWRLWPAGDKTRMLDKQIYRNLKEVTAKELNEIGKNYQLVADLTGGLKVH